MNSDTFKDRLKVAMGGESNHSFAKKCALSEGTIRRYLRDEAYPPLDTLEVIANVSGYNLGWLASGKGAVKRGEVSYPLSDDLMTADAAGEPDEGFVQVPRYKVEASAGGGAIVSSEHIVDHLAFRADWVRNALGVPVASLALINVTGDSMEPTLSNGDLILIDRSINGVDDSGVYVLQFDGRLKVKRIHSKTDGSVDIISDNPRYPVETLSGELTQGLNVVGRVVWCGRRM